MTIHFKAMFGAVKSAGQGIAKGAANIGTKVKAGVVSGGAKVAAPFRSAPTPPKPFGPLNEVDTAIASTSANRLKYIDDARAIIKNPASTKAEKMAAQQTLKDMGAKRGASGFAFRPDGSPKIGNIVKVAASTGIAGVVAWLTFRGLGGVPGSEELGDIVDETDPNAGGMLDMGSPQFAWMSICCVCCLCCVCLVLLIVAISA